MANRMTTYLEGVVATTQHEIPCHDCPLRKKCIAGWLGEDSDPNTWIEMLHGESRMECHVHLGAQCAGAAIYRRNICKTPRDKSLLKLPADRENVFAGPVDFKNHHGRAHT